MGRAPIPPDIPKKFDFYFRSFITITHDSISFALNPSDICDDNDYILKIIGLQDSVGIKKPINFLFLPRANPLMSSFDNQAL